MKRMFCLVLAMCLLLALSPMAAADYSSGSCGNGITWVLNNGDLTIRGKGPMPDYNSATFYSKDSVRTVKIESGITSIGAFAFSDCAKLTSITIPDSVTSIAECAFKGSSALKSVKIPDGVTSIGDYAFYNCESIPGVWIPDGVTAISTGAFSDCASMKSVRLPNGITTIGDSAFSGCKALTSVTIPNSVTSIDENAFYGCKALTSVTIPNGVTSISNSTFYGCKALTSVTIPNSVKGIGDYAFYNCSSLASIVIPDSVKSIGLSVFDGCIALTSVTIPYGVTSIGKYTFNGCSALKSVKIPNSVKSIGEHAFSFCSSLASIDIPDSVTFIGPYAFWFCKELTSASLPNGLKSIGEGLFENCKKLTNISLPNSVTSIGNNAFWQCEKLTSLTIPSGVTYIGSSAFFDCSSLTTMIIPASINEIGEHAFLSCGLKDLYYCGSEDDWLHKTIGVDIRLSSSVVMHYNAISIADYTVTLSEDQFVYDGTAKHPTVTLRKGSETLKEGLEYALSYRNDTDAGTATVVISGTNRVFGTLEQTYTIAQAEPILFFEKSAVTVSSPDDDASNPLNATTDGTVTYASDNPAVVSVNSNTGETLIHGVGSATITASAAADKNYKAASASYTLTVTAWMTDDWEIDAQNVLHIYGPAKTRNYPGPDSSQPWNAEKDRIYAVVVHDGVTSLGSYALADLPYVTKVTLPEGLREIGQDTFCMDPELKDVYFDGYRNRWDVMSIGPGNGSLSAAKLHFKEASSNFADVQWDQYYATPVRWAVNYGVTNGTSANTFSPDVTCTRGQVVTFLWRAKGCPEPKGKTNPFTDVPAGAYYYDAVLWANEQGITNGTSANTFSPEAPCTRAHVVTFLWRSEGQPKVGSSNPFHDVPAGQYYTDAVLWAVGEKITNGTAAGTFSPDSPCSRAQIVTFLYRDITGARAEIPKPEPEPFTDEQGLNYCILAFRSIRNNYSTATALLGRYSNYTNADGSDAVFVEITYQIGGTRYSDTFLFVDGKMISSPINYYGNLSNRYFGAQSIHYKTLQLEVAQAAAGRYPGGTVDGSALN